VLEGTVDLGPTLERIETGGSFPHRNDGGIFNNRPLPGRTTPELPAQPAGYYREYVHPTPGVQGPGPQRVVVGQGGEMYYTPDHYQTFVPLNPGG
jgi:filamentous hemagglutinin